MVTLVKRVFGFLGRVMIGFVIGAFISLAVSDYLIRTAPAAQAASMPLDVDRDSP